MKRFIATIVAFLIPAALFVLLYVLMDPFRVIGVIPETRSNYIVSSDDYYGIERYLQNKKNGHSYNTFLFGNTKVMAFQGEAVCQNKPNCSFYNFGAPGESLFNIYKKLQLIAKQGDLPEKVLLVLDHKVLMNDRNTHPVFQGPAYEHHPLSSANSFLSFQMKFLKYYIADAFFISYLVNKTCGCWRAFMAKHFNNPIDFRTPTYNPISNCKLPIFSTVLNYKIFSSFKASWPKWSVAVRIP